MDKFELLTESQKQIAESLIEYLQYGTINGKVLDFIVLEGYAGTGKSFTLNRVIERVAVKIAVTAPTHKAVQILKKSSEHAQRLQFGTIHSLLGLKQIVSELGVITYEATTFPPARIQEVQALIVDEVSMLDPILFQYIMDYCAKMKEYGTIFKVIFTGDPLQIPPVGQKQSYVFTPEVLQDYSVLRFTLSEPMRQAADNPVLGLATNIRQAIHSDYPIPSRTVETPAGNIVRIGNDSVELHQVLSKLFKEEFEANPDHAKVLAWTNNEVNRLNDIIRKQRTGISQPDKIYAGEYLIADSPIFKKGPDGRWQIIINTSEELLVKELKVEDYKVRFEAYKSKDEVITDILAIQNMENTAENRKTILNTLLTSGLPPLVRASTSMIMSFKVYTCTIHLTRADQVCQFDIHVIHEDSEQLYKDTIHKLEILAKRSWARKAAWRDKFSFENHFANVKYNYALTVHKSQGSSYTNTVVMFDNLNNNKKIKDGVDVQREERNRIKYVAVSRAKENLYLVTN